MVETKSKTLEEIDFAFSSKQKQEQWEARVLESQEVEPSTETVSTKEVSKNQLN